MVTATLSREGAGVATVVEALSRSLCQFCAQVAVFAPEDQAWKSGDREAWNGATPYALQRRGPMALGYSPDMTRRLIEWEPDLVHAHGLWMHPSRSVLQWSKATGKPYLISPHGMLSPWALNNAGWKKRLAALLYENSHIKNAALLHALCSQESEDIRTLGLNNRTCIIPNGVERPYYKTQHAAPWTNTFAENKKILLYLGRLHPIKNIQTLLEAYADVCNTSTNTVPWNLVIAGWDQDTFAKEIKARVEQLSLTDRVYFTGPLFDADKDAALRNADAFVLPSVSEGLPLVILEAWSYGLPVLMTRKCNLPEGFEVGAAHQLGLSKSNMSFDLSAFLRLTDNELARMGEKARTLAKNRFGWTEIAQNFASVYQELTQNSRTPNMSEPPIEYSA